MGAWATFSLSACRDQSRVLPPSTEIGTGIGPRRRGTSFRMVSSGVGLSVTISSDQSRLVKPIGGSSLVIVGCSVHEG